MSMERSRILDLYKKEIITLEEAIELLEAMDMEMPEEEIRQEDKERREYNNSAKNFSDSIKEGADKIFNSAREFLNSEKVKSVTEKTFNTFKDVGGTIFTAVSEDVKSIYNSAKRDFDRLEMTIIPSSDGMIHVRGFQYQQEDVEPVVYEEVIELADDRVKITDRTVTSATGVTMQNQVSRMVVEIPENINLDLTRTRTGKTELNVMTSSSKISLSGAATLTGEAVLKDVKANLSGATNIETSKMIGNCNISLSGASYCKAQEIECQEIKINCSGACNVTVNSGTTGHAEIGVSGASSVTLSCDAESCSADASGASSIHVSKVTGEFRQKASGVSSISSAGN